MLKENPILNKLLNEIHAYPGVPKRWSTPDFELPQDVIIPIEMRFGEQTLRLFSTITTLGSPHDITLQELRIESFHPADQATADFARSIASQIKQQSSRQRFGQNPDQCNADLNYCDKRV